jgi:FkbM family methyltransferase
MLRRRIAPFKLFSDGRSRRAFRELAEQDGGRTGPVELRLRALQDASITARPGTSDHDVLWDAFFHGYHRPPAELGSDIQAVWDLGSNIGLTIADLAVRLPRAQIVGVELDRDNVDLCRGNVRPWADRCRVVEAGVWPEEGEIRYRHWPTYEYGSAVVAAAQWESEVPDRTAPALPLNALLADHGPAETIDYVKMDIEGAERFVLRRNTEWSQHVRCIKVEVHEPYGVSDCIQDLGALGFEAAEDEQRPLCVVGYRRRPPAA